MTDTRIITYDQIKFRPPDPPLDWPSARVFVNNCYLGKIFKLSPERSWGFLHGGTRTHVWSDLPSARAALVALLAAADMSLPF